MTGVYKTTVDPYLIEGCGLLARIDSDLLALETAGESISPALLDRVLDAFRTLTEGADSFDLEPFRELAQRVESVIALMHAGKLRATSATFRVLFAATARLDELIQNPQQGNAFADSRILAALDNLSADEPMHPAHRIAPNLRILLVDDDSICRLLLETFLARYGKCHVAMNGREAVDAVRAASEKGEHYDLICMDIRMPELNGRDAVQQVRALEEAEASFRRSGARIIMTTTVNDNQEMFQCFQVLCDAYLVKPIDLSELLNTMKTFQLVQ